MKQIDRSINGLRELHEGIVLGTDWMKFNFGLFVVEFELFRDVTEFEIRNAILQNLWSLPKHPLPDQHVTEHHVDGLGFYVRTLPVRKMTEVFLVD